MDERDRLIDLMRRVHDGDAWHGPSVKDALAGIDATAARARAIDGGHSIWEIALHVDAWRREVRARVAGKAPSMPDPADWPAVPDDDARWGDVWPMLEASHRALVDAVQHMEVETLETRIGDGRELGLGTGVTFDVMLHGIVHHDAYHAGQIALLKKLDRRG